MGDEEWRPVVGYEGLYEVSSIGRVYSVPRKRPGERSFGGKVLSKSVSKCGRPRASLLMDGEQSVKLVSRLVAEAFLPNPEGHPVVRHLDDVPDNNTLDNLKWGTQHENMVDKVRNGKDHNSIKTHCVRGHEFTQENTSVRGGSRHCRECNRIRAREAQARKKESLIEAGLRR